MTPMSTSLTTTTTNANEWKAKLALNLWKDSLLKWSELQAALRETGLSQERLNELALELGC